MIEAYLTLAMMFALPWLAFIALWVDDARKATKAREDQARKAVDAQIAEAQTRRRAPGLGMH